MDSRYGRSCLVLGKCRVWILSLRGDGNYAGAPGRVDITLEFPAVPEFYMVSNPSERVQDVTHLLHGYVSTVISVDWAYILTF